MQVELNWESLILGATLGLLLGLFVASTLSLSREARARRRHEADYAALQAATAQEREALQTRLQDVGEARLRLDVQLAATREQLEASGLQAQARIEELRDWKAQNDQAFRALAAEALEKSQNAFLQLAQERFQRLQERSQSDLDQRKSAVEKLVSPLQENLKTLDVRLREIEGERKGAYSGLREHLKSQHEAYLALQQETGNLVQALRSPQVRGHWGELQLERAVELAGMQAHVDFQRQATTGDGRRPDLIVHLPNGNRIAVDAKAPLSAFNEALQAPDETSRTARLKDYAQRLRRHIRELGSKSYWNELPDSPEFVVLFVPGEAFFSAAIQIDPELLDYSPQENVLLATPTTLIALLKAVAYGWRQHQVAAAAKDISTLGRELHERLCKLAEHFNKMGQQLEKSVESYNQAMRSLDSRVLVSARRLEKLAGAAGKALPESQQVQAIPQGSRQAPADGEAEG